MSRQRRLPAAAARTGALLAVAVLGAIAAAQAAQPVPFSRIGKDMLGDTLASAAINSKIPVLMAAGGMYKVADIAHDLGDAAIDKEDRFLGAEMYLVNQDAASLKKIEADGGDLNGEEATAIKARLSDTAYQMTVDQQSPYGYTLRTVVKNLPYAVKKVAIDKLIEKTIGAVLHAVHIDKLIEEVFPVPESLNWMLNYGGPLEEFEKGQGWGKLGTRARMVQEAAEESMKDQEAKVLADFLSSSREQRLDESAADALGNIYRKIIADNPSQPHMVIVDQYRLEAARAAVMLPAAAAPVTIAAAPAVAVAAPEPVAAAPDPVVSVIQADDREVSYDRTDSSQRRNWQSNSRQESTPPAQESQPAEQEDPAAAARSQALHEELMRVGDGKTFAVCSNGCPSNSNASWDGAEGQTLTNGR